MNNIGKAIVVVVLTSFLLAGMMVSAQEDKTWKNPAPKKMPKIGHWHSLKWMINPTACITASVSQSELDFRRVVAIHRYPRFIGRVVRDINRITHVGLLSVVGAGGDLTMFRPSFINRVMIRHLYKVVSKPLPR